MRAVRLRPVSAVAATLALAATAGLLAACTSSPARHSAASSSRSASSPARGRSLPEATPSPGPTKWLLPAPAALTDQIILSQTDVTAGTSIPGTLLVTNSSSRPITLAPRFCQPIYEVVLTSKQIPADPAFPAACWGGKRYIFKPGRTRLPITVITTYSGCSEHGRGTIRMPRCLGNRVPPLPAGHYEAILVGLGLHLPAPVPVLVTLRG